MRILYLGELWPGATALQRAQALRDLGHDVDMVDTTQPLAGVRGLVNRAAHKIGLSLDIIHANRDALRRLGRRPYDVLWVDKGVTISPRILHAARQLSAGIRLVAYSGDDMTRRHDQSPRYRLCLPVYDLHVTTKSYNVDGLRELGAQRVLFIDNAFDPETHRPMVLSKAERHRYGADIGFVGSYERERAASIQSVAQAGLPVTVWGRGWPRRFSDHRVTVMGRPVLGPEYAKVLCATKINLGFLSKLNRDVQTTRSIEIPACGAFMLAERTEEHARLFAEGSEAEFFTSVEELVAKCRYYLANTEKRRLIAANGRLRCLRSGYDNQTRLKRAIAALQAGPPAAVRAPAEISARSPC